MWLPLALTCCLLWAVVYVLDSYCVDKLFPRYWVGVVISSVFIWPVFLAAAIPVWRRLVEFPPTAASLAIVAGVAYVAAQFSYFRALCDGESGIVAAYSNLTPALLPIMLFLLTGEVLTGRAYAGIGLLVAASAAFCLLDAGKGPCLRPLGFMLVCCGFMTAFYLLLDRVFAGTDTYPAVVLVLGGVAVAGSSPLLLGRCRHTLRAVVPELRPSLGLVLAIEGLHVAALVIGQLAIDAGNMAVVAAVEGATPALTFVVSAALFAVSGRYGELSAGRSLPAKVFLVGLMASGLWLVT